MKVIAAAAAVDKLIKHLLVAGPHPSDHYLTASPLQLTKWVSLSCLFTDEEPSLREIKELAK